VDIGGVSSKAWDISGVGLKTLSLRGDWNCSRDGFKSRLVKEGIWGDEDDDEVVLAVGMESARAETMASV
jgi:hypothetical protein